MVAALEREVRGLVRNWRIAERQHEGRSFRFFEHGDVVLVCGGIGAQAARRAAEATISLYSPIVIYSVGFAGALEPRLKVGDVVQPELVVNASDGSRTVLHGGNGILVSFSSVASPEQKAKLRESFGALLVDMEAAAVAQAAQARGVEFAAVKAISDEFDLALPALERFVDSAGQFQQLRFTLSAALRPWLWPKLFQLASNSNRAASALCDRLRASLERVVIPPK
jgi:adenosylhomocysteine nucleosidase